MDREDGEMSDDNAMVVDDVKEPISYTDDCTLVSKLTIIDHNLIKAFT